MSFRKENENNTDVWVNIQDPIKEIFQSLTRAIQTQSLDIQALDRKLSSNYLTKDRYENSIVQLLKGFSTKEELEKQVAFLNDKASAVDLSDLDSKLSKAVDQISNLNATIEKQSNFIESLRDRLSQLETELAVVKTSQYDKIVAYVEKQFRVCESNFETKLGLKADRHDVEMSSPQRLEELYRHLSTTVSDIQIELARKATKDDINNLSANKAEGKEIREIVNRMSEFISLYELQKEVSSQVKPLVSAISSLEKMINVQDQILHKQHSEADSKTKTMLNNLATEVTRDFSQIQQERLLKIIRDELKRHDSSDTIPLSVESAIQKHTTSLLRDISNQLETTRNDILEHHSSVYKQVKNDLESRIEQAVKIAEDGRDRSIKVKHGVKEFASNVAKSLARKAEISEISKSLSLQANITESADEKNYLPRPNTGGFKDSKDLDETLSPIKADEESPYQRSSIPTSTRNKTATLKHPQPTKTSLSRQAHAAADIHSESHHNLIENKILSLQNRQKNIEDKFHTYDSTLKSLQYQVKDITLSSQILRSDHQVPIASNNEDWRLALGELSNTVRRELHDKITRDEMMSTINEKYKTLGKNIKEVQLSQQNYVTIQAHSKVENDLVVVKAKVISTLTQGRWLWTSGAVVQGGWIPWDNEAMNSSPSVFSWRQGGSAIVVKLGGLYRLSVAVFTSLSVAIQVCVNGEPILTLQPSTSPQSTGPVSSTVFTEGVFKEEKYVVRRLRHTAGDITCVSVDDYVSLPTDAAISVRFHAQAAAQAFLAISKL